MARTDGNRQLKAARQAAGYASQQALADAMTSAATHLGIRSLSVGVRQIRRWESSNPPWPHADHQRVLTHLLGQNMTNLGFTPPYGKPAHAEHRAPDLLPTPATQRRDTVPTGHATTLQPPTIAGDIEAATHAHRRMYWSVAPATLHPAVLEHARLGCALLPQATGRPRQRIAAAVAESFLLAGRMEFFDLRQPEQAAETLTRAFQAAGEAEAHLLGAAILAHSAFIPGWTGQRAEATERMTAARAYARRGAPPRLFLAWLDSVEAECETRCGDPRTALHLIGHAEDLLDDPDEQPLPAWMDWFTPVRLGAFKGNTQLIAGHLPQARDTLTGALAALPGTDDKQRTVILGDLAAVEAAAGNPQAACTHALTALDLLGRTWYATGMERIREVRRNLQQWQHEPCVRDLDDRLYGWSTTVSALTR